MNKTLFIILLVVSAVAGCSSMTQKQQSEEAKKHWNQAREGVLAGLAKQQFESGDFDNCRKSLDQAIALNAMDPGLFIISAKLNIEQGRLESAQNDLKQAQAMDAKNGEAFYLSGVIYQRWRKPADALDYYAKACEAQPAELAYLLARSEMLVSLDRREEALGILNDKMSYFENSAAIRDAAGQILMQQGDYKKAYDLLKAASILQPEDPGIREHAALAAFFSGNYVVAEQSLSRMVKEERFAKRSDIWSALGQCQMQGRRYEEARDSFKSACQADPANSQAWLDLSKATLQSGDVSRARQALNKSLALDPNNSQAHLMAGYLFLKEEKLSEAKAEFIKAHETDLTDTVSLCMIGYVLEKQGRSAEAVEYYGQALRLRPSDELATKLMATVNENE